MPMLLRRAPSVARLGAVLLLLAVSCGTESGSEADLQSIRLLGHDGSFEAMEREAEAYVARHPDDPRGQLLLGLALMQQGQVGRAVWPLEKAAKAEGETGIQAGLLLTNALYTTEGFEEASRAAERVLERDPDRVAARLLRAQAQLDMSHGEEALKDVEHVLASHPDHYQASVLRAGALAQLGRFEEAEAATRRIHELAAEQVPVKAGATCVALPSFIRDHRRDLPEEERKARVEQELLRCLETFPGDPTVVGFALWFYDVTGRMERGHEILREAIARDPRQLQPRKLLARRLTDAGQPEEATQLLREAAEETGSVEAWRALVEHLHAQKDLEGALAALEEARAAATQEADQEVLRFQQADLLIELGRVDEARALRNEIDTPVYRDMLAGRLAQARGDAAAALEAFEQGVRQWPNNAGARLMAAQLAEQLGDWDRAREHYREANRLDPHGNDAGYRLALRLYEEGKYFEALQMASRQARGQSEQPELILLAARIYLGLDQLENARRMYRHAMQWEPHRAEAVAGLAAVENEAEGPAAAWAAVRDAGLDLADPDHAPALRAGVGSLVALGRFDEARALAERAEAMAPGAGPTTLRGQVLLEEGRIEEARAAFDAALARDSEYGPALAGLAGVHLAEGRPDDALALFDRAASTLQPDPEAAYRAAQVALRAEDRAEAERRLRALLTARPGHAGAANDLAWILAQDRRELDLARDLAQRAAKLRPEVATLDTLGVVHLARGEPAAARRAFERALELEPGSAELRFRRGQALAAAGRTEEAAAALREALATGSFPQEDEARAELARLDGAEVRP